MATNIEKAATPDQVAELLRSRPIIESLESRPKRRHEPFELTDLQHAYVFGARPGLELGGVAAQLVLEFACPWLDTDRVDVALQKVVDRHDMLRATLHTENVQQVRPMGEQVGVAVTDLRALGQTAQADALDRIRRELRDTPVATGTQPVEVRATVLDAGDVRLHVWADLRFVDVRSVLHVLRALRRHYDDPAWSPPRPEIAFRDCVEGRQRPGATDTGDPAADYWLSRLDGIPSGPELPLRVAPEQLGRPEFVHLQTRLSARRWAALSRAARSRGLLPATVLLLAYDEVLRAWSKEQDLTVTVTCSDRPESDGVDPVGPFTTPMLWTLPADRTESFAQRAARGQQRLHEDLQHASFGGIQVMRELARARGSGRVAMPVVFSSLLDDAEGGGALCTFGELVEISTRTPQIWLENQVAERNGVLLVTWNAVDGLFPAGVLEDMFTAYERLLDRLTEDGTAWDVVGSAVPLPDAQDEQRRGINATDSPLPDVRLHDLVTSAARRDPHAPAVIDATGEYTFGWLSARSARLANHLVRRCRPTAGEPVAVTMRPGAEQIAAILGILHAGGAYVALDPDLPAQRTAALLRRCRVRAVITEPALRPDLAPLTGAEILTLADCDGEDPEPPRSAQGTDDLAYIIFTSGSTGEPKGVMITHRSAANTVQDINRRFEVSAADRVLALAPTGFDLSVYDIFGVLGAGGAIVVPEPGRAADVGHWIELMQQHRVTIWNTVPAPMRLWADGMEGGDVGTDDRLRLVLLSGDWIPVDLPDRIRRHAPGARVISLGGATEGSIWSIVRPIDTVPPEWVSIPYGRPLANQTMHVLDRWSQPCPTWVTGEIHIGGVGVALGYWDDPERTAERFYQHGSEHGRLYRTGDLGRYLPDGEIEILGREDHQVKVNGYRVELGEIEAALVRRPGVQNVVVTAPVHPRSGQRQIVAYVIVDGPLDEASLRSALAEELPGFMVPSHYLAIETVPLTSNGKIDRGALPGPWPDTGADEGRTEPTHPVEERLKAIWATHLGHEDFGTADGYFDIGGDSLHAVGILREIREEFGIDQETEQELVEGLFLNADVATFAGIVGSAQRASA